MRNYCKFFWLNAVIDEILPNGHSNGTFTNEFLGRTKDDLYDAFGVYSQAWRPITNRLVLTNIDAAEEIWLELSKDNVYFMFRLLATAFSQCVTTWNGPGLNFSGTVPQSAFFPLFVGESPRATWSNGH